MKLPKFGRALAFLLIGILALSWGCAREDTGGKLPISGRVTLKNQPLDQGSIEFRSVDASLQLMTGGQIQNGQFSIPAAKGLPPGRYRVRISAPVGGATVAPGEAPGDSTEVAQERIPPEWGAQSTQEIELAEGKTNFEFNIP